MLDFTTHPHQFQLEFQNKTKTCDCSYTFYCTHVSPPPLHEFTQTHMRATARLFPVAPEGRKRESLDVCSG